MTRPREPNGKFVKYLDEFANLKDEHARYRARNRKKGLCAQCATPSKKFL